MTNDNNNDGNNDNNNNGDGSDGETSSGTAPLPADVSTQAKGEILITTRPSGEVIVQNWPTAPVYTPEEWEAKKEEELRKAKGED